MDCRVCSVSCRAHCLSIVKDPYQNVYVVGGWLPPQLQTCLPVLRREGATASIKVQLGGWLRIEEGSWLPPQLQTAPRGVPSRTLPVRNAASGRFSDRGLVAEVGAAGPRRSPVHTVHLSAGSILQP